MGATVGVPDLVGGCIPPGRYGCTEADIASRFVSHPEFATSATRPAIWQEWILARALLCQSALVYSVWVSGSFLTDKQNPGDIDVIFVISEEDRVKRSTVDRQVIESFVNRVPNPSGTALVPAHGLRVDSYLIAWKPHHMLSNGTVTLEHGLYAQDRGYWDDWWSRKRISAKGSPPVRADALPQRGYLEVSINAFA